MTYLEAGNIPPTTALVKASAEKGKLQEIGKLYFTGNFHLIFY